MIFLAFALLTALATLSILLPLARPAPLPEDSADLAFCRAQIAEIDAEVARGVVEANESLAAKALAGRRLLASATQDAAWSGHNARRGGGSRRSSSLAFGACPSGSTAASAIWSSRDSL